MPLFQEGDDMFHSHLIYELYFANVEKMGRSIYYLITQ